MGTAMIDIVVTTHNRLNLLVEALMRIREYTKAPYRLTVIDDASEEKNVTYLYEDLWSWGVLDQLILRGERCGPMSACTVGAWSTFSDPVVFTDDDVWAPDGIEPCWLQRGLDAMAKRPDLGLLALNHPGARRGSYEQDGEVTLCKYVGGTFMFARRAFLERYALPHERGNFGHAATQFRSQSARRLGWKVGYLTETFCYHAGLMSANGSKYGGRKVEPDDWLTLRPAKKWIWSPEPEAVLA